MAVVHLGHLCGTFIYGDRLRKRDIAIYWLSSMVGPSQTDFQNMDLISPIKYDKPQLGLQGRNADGGLFDGGTHARRSLK